jgi:hypothetical protein
MLNPEEHQFGTGKRDLLVYRQKRPTDTDVLQMNPEEQTVQLQQKSTWLQKNKSPKP